MATYYDVHKKWNLILFGVPQIGVVYRFQEIKIFIA